MSSGRPDVTDPDVTDPAQGSPGGGFDASRWEDTGEWVEDPGEPEAVSAAAPCAGDIEAALGRRDGAREDGASTFTSGGVRFGLGLAGLLAARPGPEARSTREVVDHVDGWGRVIAFAQACQAAEVAELFARREAQYQAASTSPDPRDVMRAPDPVRVTTSEVALATQASPRAAERVLDDAHTLARMPATADALRWGRIDLATVRAIGDESALVAPEHRGVVEAAALGKALDGGTAAQVRAFTRRTATKLDPGSAAARARAARAERGVSKTEVVDDMGRLNADLTAVELKNVWDTLTARARTLPGVDEAGNQVCLDDRRATVLVDMITHPEKTVECAHPHPGRWKTDMVVAASTIAGWDEDPAHLPGYGLVTADTARQVAADSDWRRTDVDEADHVVTRSARRHRPVHSNTAPEGVADSQPSSETVETVARRGAELGAQAAADLALASTAVLVRRVGDLLAEASTSQRAQRSLARYRPTLTLRDHVEAIHRRCRFPGCRRPATECDLDHVTAHRAGGATSACNLIPSCRFHHVLKHTDGWAVALAAGRTVTWTTPTRRRYRDPPPTVWD